MNNKRKFQRSAPWQAKLPWWKTFYLGVLAGAYIGFGCALALSVGGAVPGIVAAGAPGVQRILFGAFGLPFGTHARPAARPPFLSQLSRFGPSTLAADHGVAAHAAAGGGGAFAAPAPRARS